MIQKLVDNTVSDGRAEEALKFSDRFLRFIRGKYSLNEIKNINVQAITQKFHLKGIVFGNYTEQEVRHFYLYKTAKQMECLSKIKGNNNIGKGILTLSIGAHGVGGAINAHYSPSEDLINLARGNKGDYKNWMKGENSFVHEYGHFLDFEQGRKKDSGLRANFASDNLDPNWRNKKTVAFSELVDTIIENETYFKGLSTPYLKRRIEIFARLFEAAITHYVKSNYPEYRVFFDRNYHEIIYYPKSEMIKQGIIKKVVTILKES